jgi:transcriptional regulator with XRE-family HTH domain
MSEPSPKSAAEPSSEHPRPLVYRRARGLSRKHLMAIELKIEGLSDREIAERLGLHRVTVTNWMNHDHKFRAELNRRAAEVLEEGRDLARATRRKALDRISQAVQDGDLKSAFRFYELTERNAALFATGSASETRLEQEAAVAAFADEVDHPAFHDAKVGPMLRRYSAEIASKMNRWEFIVATLAGQFAHDVEVPEDPRGVVELEYEVDRAVRFLLEALWSSEGEGLRALDPKSAAAQDAFLLEAKAKRDALITIELDADAAPEVDADGEPWPGGDAMTARVLGLAEILSLLLESVRGATDIDLSGRDDGWSSIVVTLAKTKEVLEAVTTVVNTDREKAQEVGAIAAELVSLRDAVRWFLWAFKLSMRDQLGMD